MNYLVANADLQDLRNLSGLGRHAFLVYNDEIDPIALSRIEAICTSSRVTLHIGRWQTQGTLISKYTAQGSIVVIFEASLYKNLFRGDIEAELLLYFELNEQRISYSEFELTRNAEKLSLDISSGLVKEAAETQRDHESKIGDQTRCKACAYFEEYDNIEFGDGVCKRYPPTPFMTYSIDKSRYRQLPLQCYVFRRDWCGEFKARG